MVTIIRSQPHAQVFNCWAVLPQNLDHVISICVVPVQICHPDSNKFLDTYAMLDNCSHICKRGNNGGIRHLWSRNKSNSVKTLNEEVSQMTTGWESVVSRIIGQTKVDKATKSIHQAGSTSWWARDSNTRTSKKVKLSGRHWKWNLPKYWYFCGLVDWCQLRWNFWTKRGESGTYLIF